MARGLLLLLLHLLATISVRADDPAAMFAGEKTPWHAGFDRFDYLLDDETLAIEPFHRDPAERMGIADPPAGKHRGVVIVPRQPAPGLPWVWRGCYWNHEPQTEVELLRRGFHVAYLSANATLRPGREWDAWYRFLTDGHGLSRRPGFIGMSRGGSYAYTWAVAHPDQVSAIYADNPATTPEILAGLGGLARADVPILHVCGSIDPLLSRSTAVIEPMYRALGGRISVIVKEGAGHHPHSLKAPKPLADFLQRSATTIPPAPPDFLPPRGGTRTVLTTPGMVRRFDPGEGRDLVGRGPEFFEAFACYSFTLPGVEGPVTVAMPSQAATGNPWVLRADPVGSDSEVDFELLTRGYRIVTGPVPYNADGPSLVAWDAVYQRLVDHGFSPRPVLAGSGGAAGEAHAWAIAHPDRVACVFAANPTLRATMSGAPPLDDLGPLARAGVPILYVLDRSDPARDEPIRRAESRYRALGGTITVLVRDEATPRDPKAIVDGIIPRATAPPGPPGQ